MEAPFLQTKLYIPPIRPDLVARPRLIERLNEGLGGKLILVSAPAGFGKTTVVSNWLNGLDVASETLKAGPGPQSSPITSAAWLSLDEYDNDLTRFFTYLIATLQQIEASIGQNVQSLLLSPQPASVEHLTAVLVNDLAQQNQSIVLILDDYHHIREKQIHQSLMFLLDNLPPNMHLVMTTRRDPPLPLARLRVRRNLIEIREQHLRFTNQEAILFFQQAGNVDIDIETVQGLRQRTEGWVSGLQMAAISLADNPHQDNFIAQFTGSHRYVADYLMEEVLARQPQEVQNFLLHTAILDQFTVDLCNAVRQKEDSQAMMEQIERTNLFLIPLDANRNWYRYHHLFRDFLRHRLHHQYPDLLPQLHQRASHWLEQNYLIPEAIDMALGVDDYVRAADLVEQIAQSDIIKFGRWQILLNWLQALPHDLIKTRPHLCLYHAWALLTTGEAGVAEERLQEAEQCVTDNSAEAGTVLGTAAAIRATATRLRGNLTQTIALSQQALAQLPENKYFWRSSTALNLGTIYFLSHDLVATEQALLQAQSAARKADTLSFLLVATGYLGQLWVRRGELNKASQLYQQALDLAQDPEAEGQFINTLGMAYIGLGELQREWNDLETALSHLEEGLRLGQLADNGLILISGHITLARVKQAQGDLDAALDHIRQVEEMTQRATVTWTWLTVPNAAYLARLWIGQGQLEKADLLVQAFNQASEPDYIAQGQNLATIYLLLAQGREREALTIINEMSPSLEHGGQRGSLLEVLLLQTLTLEALKRTPEALKTLSHAVRIAESGGYRRLFLDSGFVTANLLRQLPQTPYLEQLLSQFPLSDESTPQVPLPPPSSQALLDPLSDREVQILRLMAARLSNPEIAAELLLATTTIKWYARQIYSKLGVNGRRAAVERARELNLI